MFDDFEIIISAEEPSANGTNVTVSYARGMRMGRFSLSSVAGVVARLTEAMQQAQSPQTLLTAGGGALFDALFTGRVLEAFRESLTLAQGQNHDLRLRFFSEIPSIIAIPWEYLYDQEQGHWLVLHPSVSLVRALPLAAGAPLPVEGGLRVLVMLAAPTDLSPLDSAREWSNLAKATDTAAIELIRVEPTYAALQAALRQTAHVFHFVGHGAFDQANQQGYLAFQGDADTADLVSADQLSVLLTGCKTLRLVLLNACQGAVTGTRSAFAGIAQRLIQQEVPAVIAMQAPIYDDHALRFSEEFYRALADGLSMEKAVCEGRKGIKGIKGINERKEINEVASTWGIPTFYFQGREPFAVTPLNNVQKAALLWQRVQASLAASLSEKRQGGDDGLRSILEQILRLDPTHRGAKRRQQQLENEAEAARLYAEGVDYQKQQGWRDAHRALEQVEWLHPNYRDTRSRLAEILGKLDHKLPDIPIDEQHRQIQPILNAIMRGRFVPFLGCGAARFGRPRYDHWLRGQYPPDAGEIAIELVSQLGRPVEGLPSLSYVSELTTLLEGDVALYERLYDLYAADYQPSMVHNMLAELPSHLRARNYPKRLDWRMVLFSTAFDDLLERAFTKAGQPYHLFAYHHRVLAANGVAQPGHFVHIPPNGEPVEMLEPNRYDSHDSDRHPVIVKLCGLRITPDPNCVIVTEGQYLEYLPDQEIGNLLPPTLLWQVREGTFVFLGCTSQEWHFRLLWQRMKNQKRCLPGKGWAILPQSGDIETRFWDRLDRNPGTQIEPLVMTPEVLAAMISEWLKTL